MRIGLSYRKRHYKCIFFGLLITAVVSLCAILKRLEPAFYTQLECHSNALVNDIVNRAVYDVFEGYDDFSHIATNSDGKVTSMTADAPGINKIKAAAVIKIQDELNEIASDYVHIPLMSISDFPVLNGMGITIPVKIVPMSLIDAEYDESFISNGINQTRHKLDMIIKVKVAYSGFLLNKTDTIETQVPLINSVINGDVPQYYGNLSGTDAALN